MSSLRRALSNPRRCQGVIAHRLVFCDAMQCMPTEDLLLTCPCCERFLAYCCSCTERARRAGTYEDDDGPPKLCHYYKVVCVDGACLANGQLNAAAGIGIAIGADTDMMHWAIPVDDAIDPGVVRTSQRAELLAAIHGIRKLAEFEDCVTGYAREGPSDSGDMKTWVIASDSEYVVSGMTEWVPGWKRKGWRNASGRRPKNLDLFQELDSVVECTEVEYDVRVAFWRISREYNGIADGLAGLAAGGETVEPVQFQDKYFAESDDEVMFDI